MKKSIRNLFIGAAAFTAMSGTAMAENNPHNRGANTVTFIEVDCNSENGGNVEALMSNHFDAIAKMTYTDLNGRTESILQNVEVMKSIERLNRVELGQMVAVSGVDEGKEAYQLALSEVIKAEEYCKATPPTPPKPKK